MVKKLKILYACLLIPFLVLLTLGFVKIKHWEEYRQKVVLAKDIRLVLESLLLDLTESRDNALVHVRADGLWHGDPQYSIKDGHLFRIDGRRRSLVADHIISLLVRRQRKNPDILEIRIEARQGVSLASNLRIRID
ncbi:MAG: hypothetical protein KGJ09_10295 [Candidatus Omnitrophica bacterium]|nr:hypothetical protein [Candidatus Omnitrophota bacterium]MDE2010445.1 hypothetical protein [Candidatus Omnitrophota bacterium]MDE2215362.1 hypothetical protein [Candidatus Omnitrophota bacterium]MDE2232318.1 hypothetical protein [Candidatus Omnitrophota bacterium]